MAKTAATVRNVTNLSPNTHYYVRVLAILNNEERVSSNSYGPVRTGEDGERGRERGREREREGGREGGRWREREGERGG